MFVSYVIPIPLSKAFLHKLAMVNFHYGDGANPYIKIKGVTRKMSTKCQSHKGIKAIIVRKCITGITALALCAMYIGVML